MGYQPMSSIWKHGLVARVTEESSAGLDVCHELIDVGRAFADVAEEVELAVIFRVTGGVGELFRRQKLSRFAIWIRVGEFVRDELGDLRPEDVVHELHRGVFVPRSRWDGERVDEAMSPLGREDVGEFAGRC